MIDPIRIGVSGMLGGINVYVGNMCRPNNSQKAAGAENGGNSAVGGNKLNVDSDADEKRRFDSYECQTCENRKYQDGSDDSGVSFQTPTKVAPEAAAAAVRGHEQEHVVRNQAKAEREGKEIVSQNVVLHTGICEECGKVYISGGTTTTTTKSEDKADKFNVGTENDRQKGEMLDIAV